MRNPFRYFIRSIASTNSCPGIGHPARRKPKPHDSGTAVVGGLIVSQALTFHTTPIVYLYLDRLALRLRGIVTFAKNR
jgi:hypothetical protein